MAAIIAILTGVAALVFWLGRAAQNAHHITDAAAQQERLQMPSPALSKPC